ncbi:MULTISPECIES: ABC transporter permease subunit [Paenibacillus]|jgi:putative aldouronate transport system permease protein|uniref:Sugar ABC transporter permease n=1 Tax=Paenibacillus odorifer TaxID=189426 RepID=A0A1R0X552_9BACL|nr:MULTISPECIES: ABC transporter permease subunit [Paenibacillus]AWV32563.1 sugar ABC transporter permease [Paenibacillus odorifer]ETT61349.1 binding-protein-dependent transport systems inner membrane component [Paenibacillus sp. FSL H8-237]MDH6426032.1 putative aldouronate transport system permease protein [Paenibacillus sp. PastH-4]MDH6442054.1 putative aldouronate transport system permease protein [Paenibacillus sp. PastF-4]MDH6527232.1 putative aldouronate transport system permease protein
MEILRKNRAIKPIPQDAKPKNTKLVIKKDLKKNWFVYLLAVPVVAWFLIFCYGPMWGVMIAFKDFKPLLGFGQSEWVGFKHFIDFFQGPYFWRVVKNTLLLNVWGIAFGFTAPIILSLMLNEIRGVKFKKVVQTITYMPHFISLVVVCGIIHIFAADEGIITQILQFITGKEYSSLLGYSSFFRPIYTFSGIWQSIGWDSIIYLAAMSSIDTSLYEAAEIDGVGRIKKMWHITLPQISPVIIILFIFAIGGLMSSGYEKIILLYNPLIYDTADVIASYVYRRGLREASLSYSTAVGLVSSIVNFGLLWMTNTIAKRRSEVSLW